MLLLLTILEDFRYMYTINFGIFKEFTNNKYILIY